MKLDQRWMVEDYWNLEGSREFGRLEVGTKLEGGTELEV